MAQPAGTLTPMADDWEWMWASETGRDSILRDSIESLEAANRAASSRSARLSSQLAKLQGSMESRITALSTAFDAYVELGDVREQLAGYPDTAAIRRDSIAAIEALSLGRQPQPVSARDVPYWLPYAVNAIISLASGTPDPENEKRAIELSPDAEVFIVTAAGALGHGPAVADRVRALLVCDGQLTTRQQALFAAALAGDYGTVLPGLRGVWDDSLSRTQVSDWVSWASQQAGGGLDIALAWVEDRFIPNQPASRSAGATTAGSGTTDSVAADSATTDTSATVPGPSDSADGDNAALDGIKPRGVKDKTGAAPAPDAIDLVQSTSGPSPAVAGLRAEAVAIINQGMGDETALLERSRVLRARIEDPSRAPQPAAEAEAVRVPVESVLRDAVLDAPAQSEARRELTGWLRPYLSAVVTDLSSAVLRQPLQPVTVSTLGLLDGTYQVEVAPDGVSAEVQRQLRAVRPPVLPKQTVLFLAGGGAALVIGLVLMVTDASAGFGLLVILAGLVVTGVGIRRYVLHRQALSDHKESVDAVDRGIRHAEVVAAAAVQSRKESDVRIRQLADRLLDHFGGEADAEPVGVVIGGTGLTDELRPASGPDFAAPGLPG